MTGPLVDIAAQRVVLATEDDPLSLRGGGSLAHVEVVYETYGDLSPARDNVVFVCHALTGDAHAAGLRPGETKPGWWDRLIGPGKAIDTDRFFVVSPNLLGGCSGTTGPQSIDPATGSPYFLDFPHAAHERPGRRAPPAAGPPRHRAAARRASAARSAACRCCSG